MTQIPYTTFPFKHATSSAHSTKLPQAKLALQYVVLHVSPTLSLCLPCAAKIVLPGSVLNLTNFKLQTETASALQISQPQLASFTDPKHFYVSTSLSPSAVVFLTVAEGAHIGSEYPRIELREMVSGGAAQASWSVNGSVVHSMTFAGSVQTLPPGRPQTVIAQIKADGPGLDAEPMQVRVIGSASGSGASITVTPNGKKGAVLDPKYVLGTNYTIRITAGKGLISVYYNSMIAPAFTVASTQGSCYFKVGNYMQSNTTFDKKTASSGVRVSSVQISEK